MATAVETEDETKINQVLTCTLCKEELKKPKLLPCQHSFCTQCLEQQHDEVEEGKTFCCPTCQKKLQLEDGTVENIPNNFLYEFLKEADGHGTNSTLKCTPCNEGNKSIKASHKCLDCGDTLCQHCSEYHCRLSAIKHHVVVALNYFCEGKYKEEFFKRKVRYCDVHSTGDHNVPLTGYCDMCKILICADCMQEDHNGHSITKIHSMRDKQQVLLNDELSNLQWSLRDQDRIIANIEKAINDTKQKWEEHDKEIYDTATTMYAMVDRIKEEKLAAVNSHYEKEVQQLANVLERENNKHSSLSATLAFTEMFLEKCPDCDFLYHEKNIQERMKTSQSGLSQSFKRNVLIVEKEDDEEIAQVIERGFGKISVQEENVRHNFKIVYGHEIFRKKVVMEIYGLAYNANGNEILVAGHGDGIIALNEEGCLKRTIRIDEISSAFDIHVSNSKTVFTTYVRDRRKVVIFNEDENIVNSVMLPPDHQETNSKVTVVVADIRTIFISSYSMDKIYKWQPEESYLETVISEESEKMLQTPRYICLTQAGHLAVSTSKPSTIQVYSKDGILQWVYDGENEGYPLKEPRGICCDKDGYIYVMDKGNYRIQVLHNQRLVRIIPIDEDVKTVTNVPLVLTKEGALLYGYNNMLIKRSI